jgi:carbonic anhydrase/acetyltransferase-like protein (isoleucine patch superfamily)
MVVMGVPGKIVRPIKEEELEMTRTLVKRYAALAQRYVDGEFKPLI